MAAASIPQQYRASMWGQMDPLLKKCFRFSGILGTIVLVLVFVVPAPEPDVVSVEQMPDRLARLILEKPAPPALRAPIRAPEAQPEVEKPKPPPRRRTTPPKKTSPEQGKRGRQMATVEVAQNLEQVSGSLDKVLTDLSKALPASENSKSDDKAKPRRRRRGVHSGRSSEQISSIQGNANLSAPDVSTSAIQGQSISISAISDLTLSDAAGGDIPSGGGSSTGSRSGNNELRSNESLLSVVRRYAPGIQYCYDNELKKNPGLRGKLVISITVLASGEVSEAVIVQNSLDSRAVTNCVLSQVRRWKFPAIPHGTTSFKTPFVFTPPE